MRDGSDWDAEIVRVRSELEARFGGRAIAPDRTKKGGCTPGHLAYQLAYARNALEQGAGMQAARHLGQVEGVLRALGPLPDESPTARERTGEGLRATLTPFEREVWVSVFGAKMSVSHNARASYELADVAVLQLRRLPGCPGHLLQVYDPDSSVAQSYPGWEEP